jgi:flavin-dependent dehydrogenase
MTNPIHRLEEGMTTSHDAIIIGAGPAGGTAAILLARAGWSVALVERKQFPRKKVCGEYLSATNLALFERLGLHDRFIDQAGPEIKRVALYAGTGTPEADLPLPESRVRGWGRALGREHLDTLLVQTARELGVDVRQPATVRRFHRQGGQYHVQVQSLDAPRQTVSVCSPVIIAAHGYWEVGSLPTQPAAHAPQPDDLLGFKAHFHNSSLPPGLMPLLAFPGGYGGMVHCDHDRVSLSCCVRRDVLGRIRAGSVEQAGAVVLEHIRAHCRGVAQATAGAQVEGHWLAAGPLRPGIRNPAPLPGVFAVGNAAGEAHPVIAEGVSIAMQSAWMVCELLAELRPTALGQLSDADWASLGQRYARAWRRSFAPRLNAARLFAHWAMRTTTVRATLPLIQRVPGILTWGARLSGKATQVVA